MKSLWMFASDRGDSDVVFVVASSLDEARSCIAALRKPIPEGVEAKCGPKATPAEEQAYDDASFNDDLDRILDPALSFDYRAVAVADGEPVFARLATMSSKRSVASCSSQETV